MPIESSSDNIHSCDNLRFYLLTWNTGAWNKRGRWASCSNVSSAVNLSVLDWIQWGTEKYSTLSGFRYREASVFIRRSVIVKFHFGLVWNKINGWLSNFRPPSGWLSMFLLTFLLKAHYSFVAKHFRMWLEWIQQDPQKSSESKPEGK